MISATSFGRTQCTRERISGVPKRVLRGGGTASGIRSTASGRSLACSIRSVPPYLMCKNEKQNDDRYWDAKKPIKVSAFIPPAVCLAQATPKLSHGSGESIALRHDFLCLHRPMMASQVLSCALQFSERSLEPFDLTFNFFKMVSQRHCVSSSF